MLAEELTRPFLPTWARALAPTDGPLSPNLLASLPLVIFLAVVALLQWPLAAWSERFGRRSGLILGALLGAAGLALAAALPGYAALVAARLLGAVGFAMVFVSAQGAAIDGSASHDRARSLAQFVRAILVAGLCGPPLGGWPLIAGEFPQPLLWRPAWPCWPPPWPGGRCQSASGPCSNLRLRCKPFLVGHAAPARPWGPATGLCAAGQAVAGSAVFYLLPMHLQDMGYGSAVTGRLQTIYPLTMVLLVPLAARLADRWRRRGSFVVAGDCWPEPVPCWPGPWMQNPMQLALILLGLGLGQALSITPQSALVADLARSLPTRQGAGLLGLFRLTERGGSALGPALGAWLLPAVGFSPALAVIGALVLGGSLAYGCSLSRQKALRTRG